VRIGNAAAGTFPETTGRIVTGKFRKQGPPRERRHNEREGNEREGNERERRPAHRKRRVAHRWGDR
jgi:hypothetical protein